MSTRNLVIENCNNIARCEVSLDEQKLNIKYAINGTGKSTIAKAIKLSSLGKNLDELTPFDLMAKKDKTIKPNITGLSFSNVAVFDEDYLKQYVYQKTDLLKNTFEVLIYSDEYIALKEAIDKELSDVKTIARDKPNVMVIREITKALCELLAVNKENTKLSRKKGGVKSILDDKKGALFNPPDELSGFKPFIDDEKSLEWASWKLRGISSYGKKGLCPYCASIETDKIKTETKIFQESFDETSINYSNQIKEYLEKIKDYIDEKKLNNLLTSLKSSSDRSTLEMQLVKLRSEADYLSQRLFVLANFNGYSINQDNMQEFEDKFADMQIKFEALDYFNTDLFLAEINPLNEQIKKVLEMIGKLKGEVAKFQSYLRNTVKDRQKDIDEFLLTAGFNYSFEIVIDGNDSAHALLKYKLSDGTLQDVSNPDKHLSWGERNAFALLLFMFDAISKNADLIILDDPISSFDSNKKYAIINRLFKTGNKGNSLYQKTVLMLTHDFEPIIDYVQVGGKISGDSICAHYLKNKNGIVTETKIQKNVDMLSMVVLMKELASDPSLSLPVRIGCLRKYIEHTVAKPKEESVAYNILSSVVHNRECATYDTEGENVIPDTLLQEGIEYIKKYITDFNYQNALEKFQVKSLIEMFETEEKSYFKLLILRAYTEQSDDVRKRIKDFNDVLRKYVDETYHIENDYLYSLDVRKFDIVPQQYQSEAMRFIEEEKRLMT